MTTTEPLPAWIYCHPIQVRIGRGEWQPAPPALVTDDVREELEAQAFRCIEAGKPVFATAEKYTAVPGRWSPTLYFRVIG